MSVHQGAVYVEGSFQVHHSSIPPWKSHLHCGSLFGLMGIQLFEGELHGGCYANYTTPAGNNRSVLVSGFPCPINGSPFGSHKCPGQSVCMRWETGPHQGLVSFDNILLGILVVFQCLTLEGWSTVLYLYESSVGVGYAWLYFGVVILLGSIFVLNLLVGVLTNVFIGVSDREELKGNIRRNKAKKRIENDLNNYNDWIKRGAELLQPNDITGSIERFPTWNPNVDSMSDDEEDNEDLPRPQMEAKATKSRRCGCYYYSSRKLNSVVRSKVWFWLNIGAHAVNLLFLMTLHYPSSNTYEMFVYALNYFFSCLFVINTFLAIYATGPIRFFKRKKAYQSLFNIIETILALLSIAGILSDFRTRFNLLVLVNAVWSLELVLVGKISRNSWKHLKELLVTLGQLFTSIASTLSLLAVFMYIFTIIGLRIFGNRMSITNNDNQPNFDSFWNSMLLVFQLLTGEDWHSILYAVSTAFAVGSSRVLGYATSIYFIIGIFLGSILLVTVLLALVVDKLSEVRSTEEDQVKEREELQKERKFRSEQINALRGPERNVQRRTIRRLIRFQAHNPAERARALRHDDVKSYKRQSSMPLLSSRIMKNFSFSNLDFGRASSVAGEMPSPRGGSQLKRNLTGNDQEGGGLERKRPRTLLLRGSRRFRFSSHGDDSSATTSHVMPAASKKANPLRLIKEPSSFIDEQKLRMSGSKIDYQKRTNKDSQPVMETAQSRRLGRMKARKSEEKEEKLKSGRKIQAKLKQFPSDSSESDLSDRHLIVYSPSQELKTIEEESIAEENRDDDISVDKSDLTPVPSLSPPLPISLSAEDGWQKRADSSLSSRSEKRQVLSRQSNFDNKDDEDENTTEQSSVHNESEPASLQTPTPLDTPTHLYARGSQVFARGSSLEPIHPSMEQQRKQSGARFTNTTRKKILDKMNKAWTWMKYYFGSIQLDPTEELAKIPPHSSFFIFDYENSMRHFCFSLVRSRSFEAITYTVIALSSILLMLELPVGSTNEILCGFQNNIIWIDISLILFFIVEMILKMISLGVFLHRDSYLRGFFNIVDFVILILNVIPIVYFLSGWNNNRYGYENCISYGYDTATVIGLLRVSRVFRPLRALRIGGLRLVVTGLISSLKATVYIFFINALFIIIFAVIGINYFKGSFFSCTDPSIMTQHKCVGYYFNYDYAIVESNISIPGLVCPITEPRKWLHLPLNFDNIGRAILTLFTMLTAEGWEIVMYQGINSQRLISSTSRPLASVLENSPESALYFIFYMVVMTFIFLQLFVGFVIVTFQEVGVTSFKETRLGRNERHCLYFALTAKPNRQWIPRYEFQRKFRRRLLPIVNSYEARAFIFIMLNLNTLVLMLQHYEPQVPNFNETLNFINDAFTIFFFLEVITRIAVVSPPIFFRSIWNTFEFLIAIGSIIEFCAFCAIPPNHNHSHTISTFRVLRLLRFYPAVRRILWTVINSLEVFPWVGYLLVIVVFIYSVLGMNLFGNIKQIPIDEAQAQGRGIHEYNNFASFPQALLVMLRVITGENWPDVMLSSISGQLCEPLPPNRTSTNETNCGNDFAYFFFPSFYIISTIMILNLFVAIIIDNFEYVIRDKSVLGAYDLKQFVTQWFKIDKETRGTLTPNEVFGLFRKINPPVGWGKLCPQVMAYKKMMRLNIPIVNVQEKVEGSTEIRNVKKVTFNATLFALVKNVLEIGCTGCPDCSKLCNDLLRERLIKCFPTMDPKLIDNVLAKEPDETVASEYAVLMVQAEWRAFMQRRRRLIQAFQGSEGGPLKSHRNIPDPGPDLAQQRRISLFSHDLDNYPIIPRKISETSSVWSERSRGGSRSPGGTGRHSSPNDDVGGKLRKQVSPSLLSPPPLSHYYHPLSPALEPSTSEAGDASLEDNYAKESHQFSFDIPSQESNEIQLAQTEDNIMAESPVWSRRSEPDTVSFTSAYSQLQQSDESLQMHETTV